MSRAVAERVIAGCERLNSRDLESLMSLLRRLQAEAAREEARLFASDAAAFGRAPPLLIPPRDGAADDLPALAPPVSAVDGPGASEVSSPPVQLPADRIAALAQAA